MFHANTPQHNKDVIFKSLLVPDGVVRVVFTTVALGTSIDLCDVNAVIHYGAPQCLEEYFQENNGRGAVVVEMLSPPFSENQWPAQ